MFMAQPLEVTLRDEDIYIHYNRPRHPPSDTLEGVANRIQVRQLENRQENSAENNAGTTVS